MVVGVAAVVMSQTLQCFGRARAGLWVKLLVVGLVFAGFAVEGVWYGVIKKLEVMLAEHKAQQPPAYDQSSNLL